MTEYALSFNAKTIATAARVTMYGGAAMEPQVIAAMEGLAVPRMKAAAVHGFNLKDEGEAEELHVSSWTFLPALPRRR